MKYKIPICHQIPERSFHIKNHQFPVCARCSGLYTGLGLYLVYKSLFNVNFTLNLFMISVVLVLPTTIDGLTQYLGYRNSNNTLRFLTGVIGGIGLIIIITMIIKEIINVL